MQVDPNNPNCERFGAELEAHLEGELRPFVAKHASECRDCSGLLADLQWIQVSAREIPEQNPSPQVWSRIQAAVAVERKSSDAECGRFAGQLEAFLDGDLDSSVLAHAQSCQSCGAVLADMQTIQSAAHALPLEEPSIDLWPAIRASLIRENVLLPALCAQFSEELEPYLEGEQKSFVALHASQCEPCAALLADLETIRAAARNLPEQEPSRAVWANIRARLEDGGAFAAPRGGWREFLQLLPRPVPLAVLAGVAVLATFLSVPTSQFTSRNGAGQVGVDGTQEAALTPPPEDVSVAHVVSDLETNFKANEASMNPDLKASYEKSLVSLDTSINECLDSLRQEPGNTMAHDYLLTAYTRKAEVLSSALEFEGR